MKCLVYLCAAFHNSDTTKSTVTLLKACNLRHVWWYDHDLIQVRLVYDSLVNLSLFVSLFSSPSLHPLLETTQRANRTSVLTAPNRSPTPATWRSTSASTAAPNPTPAPTARKPSDSSVTYSSITGNRQGRSNQ